MFELMKNTFRSKLFWIGAVVVLFYVYLKRIVYSYWKNQGIPQEDTAVPTGMFKTSFFLRKVTIGNLLKESYLKFKKHPFHGIYMFNNPVLMINGPELIKQILVKDFQNFCDRGVYANSEIDPMIGHLFCLRGDKWRTLRAKLSPTFTSGKLKLMFPAVNSIGLEMIKVADENLLKSDVLELKDLIARYTTDTIFSLAFGLNSNCLREPNNDFRHYGLLAVENNIIRSALGLFAPSILETLKLPLTDSKVSKFFIELFKKMVEQRKQENVRRNDFLDSLMDLMDHEQMVDKDMVNTADGISKEKIARRLDVLEAAAQAFLFFAAGFETSSSIVTYCLYELALNPEIQDKVHEEIDQLLANSKTLTNENLLQLEYLDMVFYETIRMHPSLPFLNRISLDKYKIPNSNFTIEKNTSIIISISGLHSNPDVFPEPDKFDPTRFTTENIASRHPCSYLAFGEGPRMCIAKRFGVLQSKVALFHMLANYKLSVCDKTVIPNEYSTNSPLQTPKSGVYLKVTRRKIQ